MTTAKKVVSLDLWERQLIARIRDLRKHTPYGIIRVCWTPHGLALRHKEFEVLHRTTEESGSGPPARA